MVAVIKGDIINSRKLSAPDLWIKPLRALLNKYGKEYESWELVWGDFFQIILPQPAEALALCLNIKALVKQVEAGPQDKNLSSLDVRMAIGLGTLSYKGKKVSESAGEAFVRAAEEFNLLKSEKRTLALASGRAEFDREMNLYFKLAAVIMDSWSISSAELVAILLENPDATQMEIGKKLGIRQNSVSGRRSRSQYDILKEVESIYRDKVKHLQI